MTALAEKLAVSRHSERQLQSVSCAFSIQQVKVSFGSFADTSQNFLPAHQLFWLAIRRPAAGQRHGSHSQHPADARRSKVF